MVKVKRINKLHSQVCYIERAGVPPPKFLMVYDKVNDETYVEEYKKEQCEHCSKIGSYFILDDPDSNSSGLCYYHLRKHYGYENISDDIDADYIDQSKIYQEELNIIYDYISKRGNHLAFNYDELLDQLIKSNHYKFSLERDQANKNLEQVISMVECDWSPRKNNSRQAQQKLRHDCDKQLALSQSCVQIIDGNVREKQYINLAKLKEQVSLSNKKIHTELSVKPVKERLKRSAQFRIVKCWHCGNPKQKILSYNKTFECEICKELLWTGEGGYAVEKND